MIGNKKYEKNQQSDIQNLKPKNKNPNGNPKSERIKLEIKNMKKISNLILKI